MNNLYCKIPLDPESLLSERSKVKTCSMAESIAQNLMLLITSRKQENRFDPDFGNDVWEFEFDNAVTIVHWETLFIESLKRQIQQYEPRLRQPKIEVRIQHVEHTYSTRKFSEIKKRAKIAINGKLIDTGEQYSFATELFIGPMSID